MNECLQGRGYCPPEARRSLRSSPEGGPGGVVHAEVEEEAPHGGNDEEGGDGELLQAQGRHRVHGPEQEARGVQGRDEGAEVDVGQRDAQGSQAQAEDLEARSQRRIVVEPPLLVSIRDDLAQESQ